MSSEAKRETPINILPYFLCVALCVCIFCVIQSYILFYDWSDSRSFCGGKDKLKGLSHGETAPMMYF